MSIMTPVFDSNAWPAREGLDFWRDRMVPDFLALEFEHTDPNPFKTCMSGLTLGPLQLVRLGLSGGSYLRTPSKLADDRDHFCLVFSETGGVRVTNAGSAVELDRGQATVVDYARNGSARYAPQPGKLHDVFLMNVPRRELLDRAPGVDVGKHGLAWLRGGEPYRLLLTYINALDDRVAGDPALADLAARHTLDLLALALGPSRETAAETAPSAVRTARTAALAQHIEANFLKHGLTAASAAAALGISERYVHDLMAEQGASFSETVNRRRLDAAAQMLSDPKYRHLRISDIALNTGFRDISYFNRQFRKLFGETPRDRRAMKP